MDEVDQNFHNINELILENHKHVTDLEKHILSRDPVVESLNKNVDKL